MYSQSGIRIEVLELMIISSITQHGLLLCPVLGCLSEVEFATNGWFRSARRWVVLNILTNLIELNFLVLLAIMNSKVQSLVHNLFLERYFS
jgi:hypothetical protein